MQHFPLPNHFWICYLYSAVYVGEVRSSRIICLQLQNNLFCAIKSSVFSWTNYSTENIYEWLTKMTYKMTLLNIYLVALMKIATQLRILTKLSFAYLEMSLIVSLMQASRHLKWLGIRLWLQIKCWHSFIFCLVYAIWSNMNSLFGLLFWAKTNFWCSPVFAVCHQLPMVCYRSQ